MRFCSLGSGSGGNALVVEARNGTETTRILVDCGFTQREFGSRLARAGLAPADLDAVFVTHEHSDHVGSALASAGPLSCNASHCIERPPCVGPGAFRRTVAQGCPSPRGVAVTTG